jgi:hypothetical protein
VTAAACAAMVAVIAGCSLYTRTVLRGHQPGPARYGCLRRTAAHRAATALLGAAIAILSITWVRTAVLRARWAWRCHGKPVPGDGERLTRDEIQALGNLAAGRDTRSRT